MKYLRALTEGWTRII